MQLNLSSQINESHRYEALFNHAAMSIIVVNDKSHILTANPFTLKLFGYQSHEIINQPIEILIPQRFHHKHIHHRDEYIHHPKSRPMGLGLDLFGIKKDGAEFPVEVSLGNYEDNGKKNIIAFIIDISLRKKSEAEIVTLNNELEFKVEQRTQELKNALNQLEQSQEVLSKALEKERELSELKSRFVSMASHEFRTPLSTVLSSSYLIQKYITSDDQPKRDKHLQRIILSVNMLTDILNDFLNVGKIEEGKIHVRLTEFNIKELITNLTIEIENNLKKRQKICYQHQGNLLVFLDNSLLRHIVLNLITNASKFSAEGETIYINTHCTDQHILLSVKDNGIGISKEDQKHLMERFFRGTNAGNIQGTGLGLHIVNKYAELMDGVVECSSELEHGTTFSVTFMQKKVQ